MSGGSQGPGLPFTSGSPETRRDFERVQQQTRERFQSLISVDVRDYGAKADGRDNTILIQKAIDAVAKAGGGYVYVPPGTWIATNLKLKSGVILYGAGWQTILQQKASTTGDFITLFDTNVENTRVCDLQIDGNKANQSAANRGVFYDNTAFSGTASAPHHTVERVLVVGCKGAAVVMGTAASGFQLVNVVAKSSDADGFLFDGAIEGIAVGLLSDSNLVGVRLINSADNSHIEGVVKDSTTGLTLTSGSGNRIRLIHTGVSTDASGTLTGNDVEIDGVWLTQITAKYGAVAGGVVTHHEWGKVASPASGNPAYQFQTEASAVPIGLIRGYDGGVEHIYARFDYANKRIILGHTVDGVDVVLEGTVSGVPASALADMADVTITSVAPGEVLTKSAGDWINQTLAEAGISATSHAHAIDDLTDVTEGTPADDKIFGYKTGAWKARTLAEAGISAVGHTHAAGDLSDVTITSVATSDVIQWSGSAWVNRSLAGAGIAAASHTHNAADITAQSNLGPLGKGTTAARPGAAVVGRMYENTTTSTLQRDTGSAWADVTVSSTPPPHASTHHSGGGDALTLGLIAGNLTDAQHGDRSAGVGTFHDFAQVVGTVPRAQGGTGFTSYAKGDLIYASAADTLAKRVVGSNGQFLKVASGVPAWQTVSLVTALNDLSDVTITSATEGDVLEYSSGAWRDTAVSDFGVLSKGATIPAGGTAGRIRWDTTLGYLVRDDGVSTWEAVPASTGPLSGLSDVTITSIAAGELLKWNGSSWINQTLAEAGIAAASHVHNTADITGGTLDVIRGGTNIGTYATGDMLYMSSATVMAKRAVGTNSQFLGSDGTIPIWEQVPFSALSGSIADGQTPESAVTQHEAALAIDGSQIANGHLAASANLASAAPPLGDGGRLWLDTDDDKLYYDDGVSAWTQVVGAQVQTLAGLTDTTITGPATNDLLQWDGTKWVDRTLAEAGVAAASHVHNTADITGGTLLGVRGGTGIGSYTKGDVLHAGATGSVLSKLGIGAAGEYLSVVSGLASWGKVTKLQGHDVLVTTPTDGQVLRWVNANSRWEPVDPPWLE